MKKILILGGRSFLASQFKKYLNKNNENFISVDETVSNNYSLTFLESILKKEKPSIILDFKFPLVSSNDKDYKHIDEDSFFHTQKNLLFAVENTRLNLDKLILISSSKAQNGKNLYSTFKRKQEILYETFFEKDDLKILRLDSVFGPGDLSNTRLIPFYFRNVIDNKTLNFNFEPNDISRFIFIDDALNYIYNELKNKTVKNMTTEISFIDLIQTFNFIFEKNYNFFPNIMNNNEKLGSLKMTKDQYFYNNLEKTVSWYFDLLSN